MLSNALLAGLLFVIAGGVVFLAATAFFAIKQRIEIRRAKKQGWYPIWQGYITRMGAERELVGYQKGQEKHLPAIYR